MYPVTYIYVNLRSRNPMFWIPNEPWPPPSPQKSDFYFSPSVHYYCSDTVALQQMEGTRQSLANLLSSWLGFDCLISTHDSGSQNIFDRNPASEKTALWCNNVVRLIVIFWAWWIVFVAFNRIRKAGAAKIIILMFITYKEHLSSFPAPCTPFDSFILGCRTFFIKSQFFFFHLPVN